MGAFCRKGEEPLKLTVARYYAVHEKHGLVT